MATICTPMLMANRLNPNRMVTLPIILVCIPVLIAGNMHSQRKGIVPESYCQSN